MDEQPPTEPPEMTGADQLIWTIEQLKKAYGIVGRATPFILYVEPVYTKQAHLDQLKKELKKELEAAGHLVVVHGSSEFVDPRKRALERKPNNHGPRRTDAKEFKLVTDHYPIKAKFKIRAGRRRYQ
jgi:hypothetical protein